MSRIKTHTFKGRRYTLLLEDPVDGFCDIPQKQKDFYVDPRLKGKRSHLETAVHEGIHCEFPKLPEKEVERAGREIASLLWRMGYRLQE